MRKLIICILLLTSSCWFKPNLAERAQLNLGKYQQLQQSISQVNYTGPTDWKGGVSDLASLGLDSTSISIAEQLASDDLLSKDTAFLIGNDRHIEFFVLKKGRSNFSVNYDPENLLGNIGITDELFVTKLDDKWYFVHDYNRDPDFKGK